MEFSSSEIWQRAAPTKDPSPAAFPSDFPSHKRIPGTRFVVDGFGQFAGAWSTAYFLTHFHSDHYGGLTSSWDSGVVFCSPITGRLVTESLLVNPALVVQLPLGVNVVVDECIITLVDANHCPGAVQFLFEIPADGTRFVHTGDMRFSPVMKNDASLCNFIGADAVFLDTTYCNPKFVFPAQQESVNYVVDTMLKYMQEAETRTLFLVSTYVVGKEKILLAIAERCKCLIYVDERKLALLKCLELGDEALAKFTTNESEASVHVVSWNWLGETWPYFRPNFSNMEMMKLEKKVDRVVGFVPTGWTYESAFPVRKKGTLEIYLVPYSEHSNYEELREYVGFLRPREVFPTVGLDEKRMDGKTADAMRKHFRNLVDETASKRKFLKGFNRRAASQPVEEADQLVALGRNARRRSREEFETSSSGSGVEETRKQLHDILPDWLTDAQIDKLLEQASGDLNAAVSLFFQQQSALEKENEEADAGTASDPPSSPVKEPTKSPATPSAKKPSKPIPATLSKKSAKKLKLRESARGQASILSFFKKETTVAAAKPQVKKQLVMPVLDTAGSRQQKPESLDEPKLDEEPKADEKLEQLMTILDGEISEAVASSLLEKAGGDIGGALDLHYGTSSSSGDKLESCDMKLCGGQEDVEAPLQTQAATSSITLSKESTGNQGPSNVSLPLSVYDPVSHACWRAEEPAPYVHLARTFDLVEKESGRHRTTEMLCNMFRSLIALSPGDVLPSLYLLTNRIAPDYENEDLNIGSSIVVAAIEEATGTPKSKLKEMYNTLGDLGDVAQACRQTQSMLVHPRPLSISHVFDALKQISKVAGAGSTARKRSMVVSLLRCCREKEVTYIVRTLVQNMRIGAMIRTVLPALAQAVLIHQETSGGTAVNVDRLKPKLQEASGAIVQAFNLLPNFDCLVPYVLQEGVESLSSRIVVTPGIPIKPMLAKITNGLSDALKRFMGQSMTCEFKYDGFRAQIHLLEDGSVRIFSRNCENSTMRFPDVVETIKSLARSRDRSSFILDAELVAVDRKNNNKLLAFQSLSTRERGGKAGATVNITVDICVFLFDIMYLNSEPLVRTPLRARRERMHDLFPTPKPGFLQFAEELTLDPEQHNEETIRSFLHDSIAASCEGLMVKALDEGSDYAPAQRADSWLKVKKDYLDGLSDSLDLVPIGAWYGNGRKAGWFSPFLLACYDPEQEEYQSVCRVMSGFTDAFYEQMKEFYSGEQLLTRKPSYYRTLENPDVWFSPAKVWEIRGADYTVSPVHQAALGMVHPDRGISLRFPRFVVERFDKSPEDASTPSEIVQHFNSQIRKVEIKK